MNLVGQKFSKLTVIAEASPIGGRTTWQCQCDCGIIKDVKAENLRRGHTTSCGCWNQDQRSSRAFNMYKECIKYAPQEASARRVWQKNYSDMLFDDFYELSQKDCYYCNESPSNSQNIAGKNSSDHFKENANFTYNGLDRLDSSLPHSKENCVPCCKYCNYAKRERTEEEFKNWIIKVYNIYASK